MGQQLHLLAKPDIRALRDAREWFLDGRQLICRLPVLWLIAYSGIYFALLLLSVSIIFLLSSDIYGLFLWTLIVSCLFIIVQSGAYRLMGSRIGGGEKLRLREMFQLPGQNARKPFLRCLLFLAVLHGVIMVLLVMWFFYTCLYFSYFQFYLPSFKWPLRLICAGMSFMVFSITWAILPILSVFPETGFSTILRLQLCGTLRNWRPFCYFILFVGGLFFLLYLAETYFSFMTPYSVEIGFVVVALLRPLTFVWRFSAARHIFMIRE